MFEEKIKEDILNTLDDQYLKQTARESNFIQRNSSKISGPDFIELLTTAMVENPYVSLDGLCDILSQINPEAVMTPQGLSERINSDQAVEYLKTVFENLVKKNLESVMDQKNSIELFSSFNKVFLEDSSQCELNNKLADEFKGSGGSASKSSLKINLIYEFIQNTIYDIYITDSKEPDQALAGRILDSLQANDLIIRDLGYFSLKALVEFPTKNAFFLSRLTKLVNVYLSERDDTPIDNLGKYFLNEFPDHAVADIDAFIGQKERLPCRLIIYRLPEEIVNERIRKARKTATKKGRVLTQEQVAWLHFSFFITNVKKEIWPTGVIGTIYRIRWRIELIFKTWKSLLQIHVLKGTRPERIRCIIYGRLILIAIMTMIYSYASYYSEQVYKREVSAHKLFNWLNRTKRLGKAAFSGSLDFLITEMKLNILRNCTQKRIRKHSLELLLEEIPYMESFESNHLA